MKGLKEYKRNAAEDLFSLLLRSIEKDEEMDDILKKENVCMINAGIWCYECVNKDNCTLKKAFDKSVSDSRNIDYQIFMVVNIYAPLLAYLLDTEGQSIPWLRKHVEFSRRMGYEPSDKEKMLAEKLKIKL